MATSDPATVEEITKEFATITKLYDRDLVLAALGYYMAKLIMESECPFVYLNSCINNMTKLINDAIVEGEML